MLESYFESFQPVSFLPHLFPKQEILLRSKERVMQEGKPLVPHAITLSEDYVQHQLESYSQLQKQVRRIVVLEGSSKTQLESELFLERVQMEMNKLLILKAGIDHDTESFRTHMTHVYGALTQQEAAIAISALKQSLSHRNTDSSTLFDQLVQRNLLEHLNDLDPRSFEGGPSQALFTRTRQLFMPFIEAVYEATDHLSDEQTHDDLVIMDAFRRYFRLIGFTDAKITYRQKGVAMAAGFDEQDQRTPYTVYIPKGINVSTARLREVMIHEVNHLLRAKNGRKHAGKLLSGVLPNYLIFEEGMNLALEQMLQENVTPYKGAERALAVAFELGLVKDSESYASKQQLLQQYYYLQLRDHGVDQANAHCESNTMAFNRMVRVLSGTGSVENAAMTKESLYFKGNIQFWTYMQELDDAGVAFDHHLTDYLLFGKFNPTIEKHRTLIEQYRSA